MYFKPGIASSGLDVVREFGIDDGYFASVRMPTFLDNLARDNAWQRQNALGVEVGSSETRNLVMKKPFSPSSVNKPAFNITGPGFVQHSRDFDNDICAHEHSIGNETQNSTNGLLVQREDAWLATRRSGFNSPAGPLN